MSTGLIIAIVVVAVILVTGLAVFTIRTRRDARMLKQRRKEAVTASRQEAEQRAKDAERADMHARIAQAEAERSRAESQLHTERAAAYEKGMADDQLADRKGGSDDEPADREGGAPDELADREGGASSRR